MEYTSNNMNTPKLKDLKNANQFGAAYIKKHYPEFYNWLIDKYKDYPQDKFPAYLYLYFNNLSCPPTCPVCGNPTPFLRYSVGFQNYCSSKCSNSDPEVIKKKEQTSLEKYGDVKPQRSDVIKQKSRETSINLYGGQGNESKIIKEKQQNTMIKRYGVGCFSENPELLEKSKKTKLERYGNPFFTNTLKSQQTNTCRYGGVGRGSQILREKIEQTKLERYGDVNYSNREKIKETCLKKYGVEYYSKSRESIENNTKLARQKSKEEHPDIIDFVDSNTRIYKCPHQECDKCVDKQYISNKYVFNNRMKKHSELCTILKPINDGESGLEVFVKDILNKHNIKFLERDRKQLNGMELDIYIPSHNLAIECNGVLFHSSGGLITKTHFISKPNNYHINKYIKCQEKGIQLISIWEDQIINIPDIVESLILSKLGIYKTRIYGRQCEVCEIKHCSDFLRKNHMQGNTNSNIKLGLFHENVLVGVMTFSKPSKLSGSKKDKKDYWVLSRFCTKLNTQVIGGADKLLKYFIRKYNPKIIESYASNDISNGNLYKRLGFIQDGHITGAYWYVSDYLMTRYHRTSFTKSKLKDMGYDTVNNTESDIMNELPFHKIYDSGHVKYTLTIS